MSHIHGDNNTTKQFKGLATRNSEGKFVITIGNNTYTYESYNDFILNNDIVRLNTKPNKEGKSNFNRKGERSQGANQVFDIKISSSSPVEGLNTNEESIATPEEPVVKKVDFDFKKAGYSLCIVDTGGNHSALTNDYADIFEELKNICGFFK